ncbi:MAG: VacJ family lipoprotein [Pseudomonadota bacterium]|nr:VacJ family lipoprotein [Pseudomonadota bacterium]
MTPFRSDMSRVDAAGTAETGAAPNAVAASSDAARARLPRAAAALLAAALLAGCAAGEGPKDGELVYDPWEKTNREVHAFNKGLDTVLLRPASQLYDIATPGLVKHLVRNGLDMLQMPAIFVNYVLQGDVDGALTAFGRFGINAVMGLGLLDPATEMGLPKEYTDFGLTLASWGVEQGPYLELPILGPANLRDGPARIGHWALDPVTYVTSISAFDGVRDTADLLGSPWMYPVRAAVVRSEIGGQVDEVLYGSEDSYVTTRAIYTQLRRRQEAGGETTADALPDVFAE